MNTSSSLGQWLTADGFARNSRGTALRESSLTIRNSSSSSANPFISKSDQSSINGRGAHSSSSSSSSEINEGLETTGVDTAVSSDSRVTSPFPTLYEGPSNDDSDAQKTTRPLHVGHAFKHKEALPAGQSHPRLRPQTRGLEWTPFNDP